MHSGGEGAIEKNSTNRADGTCGFYFSLTIFLTACAASPSKTSPPPNAPSTSEQSSPIERTDVDWVDRYGAEIVCPATLEEEALWRRLPTLTCERDDRLTKAARHHAETLLDSPGSVSAGRMEHLRFTVYQLGGFDYGLQPAVGALDKNGTDYLVSFADDKGRTWTHCGLGVAENGETGVAVLVGVTRTIAMSSLPITNPVSVRRHLAIRSTRKPEGEVFLYLGKPDTSVVPIPSIQTGDVHHFDIPLDAAGRYELELLHDQGFGPETAVLIPFFAGIPPDPRPIVVPDVRESAEVDPEAALLRYLNGARKKVGLSALKRDPRLDSVARAHSIDMARHKYFGHVSPLMGGLLRRLDRAGLNPKRSAENIAESSTPLRIHRNLMASPAHRLNMLSPDFTHVGIGVATAGVSISTQIFATW